MSDRNLWRECRNLAFGALIIILCAASSPLPNIPPVVGGDALATPAIRVLNPASAVLETVTVVGNRLVAGGEHGLIIFSDDDGVTWRQAIVPVDVTILSIRFSNPEVGWAVGHFGVVLRSDDGGQSWAKQFDGVQAANLLLSDAKTALAASPNDVKLQHKLRHAQETVEDGPDKPFFVVQPLSDSHVRIYGADNLSFDSADGGKTWADWSGNIDNPQLLHIYTVVSNTETALIAGEQGLLVQGPLNGPLQSITPPVQASFFGAAENDAGETVIFGLQGNIYLSAENGKTWEQVQNKSTNTIDCGFVTKDKQFLFGDSNGIISLLTGQTLNMTRINVGFPIIEIAETQNGSLIVVGFGGLVRIPAAEFAQDIASAV